jgi:hypothetical protein
MIAANRLYSRVDKFVRPVSLESCTAQGVPSSGFVNLFVKVW